MVRRVLVRLLVALLVPLVMFANPATAEAASGDWVGVQWHMGIGVSEIDVVSLDCGANFGMAAVDGGSTLYQRDGYCKGGADVTPGVCQLGESTCTSVTLSVEGPGCDVSMSPADYEGPQDGWGSTDMRWDMSTAAVGSCDPTEACISVTSSTMLGGTTKESCEPVALDPPVDPGASRECVYGTVTRPVLGAVGTGQNLSVQRWTNLSVSASVTAGTQPDTSTWTAYAIVAAPPTPGGVHTGPSVSATSESRAIGLDDYSLWDGAKMGNGASGTVSPRDWTFKVALSNMGAANAPAPPAAFEVIGVGVFRTAQHTGYPSDSAGGHATAYPTRGPIGRTDPSVCAFYWGQKHYERADSTSDDPVGALPTPGVVSEPGGTPEPVVDEETPDTESGLLDWLAGLLRTLIGAIKSLGTAIAGIPAAILGGLSALFVPVNAPDWSDVPSPLPEGWVPSMPSLGGAGCGALSFPRVELGFNDMSAGPVDFANTCAAPWPTVRLFTYNGTLVLVLVSAVWMGFRAIASGLGIGVAMGSGGRDDD